MTGKNHTSSHPSSALPTVHVIRENNFLSEKGKSVLFTSQILYGDRKKSFKASRKIK